MRLCILLIASSFFLCSVSCASTGIVLKKQVETDLSKYKTVYINVEHDAYKTLEKRQNGPETTYVRGEIWELLQYLGMERVFTEKTGNLEIKCLFRHGWGLPRLTIHFYLKTRYISWVNIQLIDQDTKEVLGEVEYTRPWSKTNPQGLYKKMIETMIGKKIE